jgi:hypothetical protein
MTKSIKNRKAIYTFLDGERFNIELGCTDNKMYFAEQNYRVLFNINQTTANELIKVLKEFVNTGDLK